MNKCVKSMYSSSIPSDELRAAMLQGLIANDRQYLMNLHTKKMNLIRELEAVNTNLQRKAEDILILEGMLYAD